MTARKTDECKITFRLPVEQRDALASRARVIGMTVEEVLRAAVTEVLAPRPDSTSAEIAALLAGPAAGDTGDDLADAVQQVALLRGPIFIGLGKFDLGADEPLESMPIRGSA